MTDQIYQPNPQGRARTARSQEQLTKDEWKEQLGRLLDDYRNHYVLAPRPEEEPRP